MTRPPISAEQARDLMEDLDRAALLAFEIRLGKPARARSVVLRQHFEKAAAALGYIFTREEI
jgi:hypothetical protein